MADPFTNPPNRGCSGSFDFEEARYLGARRPAVNRLFQLNLSGMKPPRNKAAKLGFGADYNADLVHPSETEGSA